MQRHRLRWGCLAAALFALEVLIATVGSQVPFVRADLGDFLVVVLVYALVKAVRPVRATTLGLGVFVFATAVECSQALGLAQRKGFARGSLGSLILGTTFQASDLAMYAGGCLAAWLVDVPGRDSRAEAVRAPLGP